MNQENSHLLETHVWQLQAKEKQLVNSKQFTEDFYKSHLLLGTDIWQLINKETKFGDKKFQAGYPQTLFFYLLNRGACLQKWETQIKDLKKKLHFLLLERVKNKQKINIYER